MAYDGWITYDDAELINLSRTTQLAQTLGIETVWQTPELLEWIETDLGGVGYNDISTAPWYDPGFPASSEFAGLVPLSVAGLDDSTLTSTPVEYITDGGHAGAPRNTTLAIVFNVAIVASTDRGAEFGKRWLDRRLRNSGRKVFCSGADLTYYRSETPPVLGEAEKAHRRNVRTTRGTTVTRKRVNDCDSTWWVTFTMTAADPFEYGESKEVLSGLGGNPPYTTSVDNAVSDPQPAAYGGRTVHNNRWFGGGSATGTYTIATGPNPAGGATFARKTWTNVAGLATNGDTGFGMDFQPPGNMYPITGGDVVYMGAWMRTSDSGKIAAASLYTDAGRAYYAGPGIPLPDNVWTWVNFSVVAPAGATYFEDAPFDIAAAGPPWVVGKTLDICGMVISVNQPFTDPPFAPSGALTLIEEPCPVYDYTPIYDPLYPALVPSPTAPDFYPAGWGIVDGMTFDRFWARIEAPEPSELLVVPTITLTATEEARMVRVSIWSGDDEIDDQCDPLFSAVVTYLPPNVEFVIDGEQKASYVWDGFSPQVRRADSLVYSPDARPVQWTTFNDPNELLVTLDIFSDSDGEEGGGTVRASLELTPKSD